MSSRDDRIIGSGHGLLVTTIKDRISSSRDINTAQGQ